MVGETFSHYHVIGKLGEGATAVVYKAEDLVLGRAVALKFLPKELSETNAGSIRFEHEARTASSLNHPNICTIYEVGEHQGGKFLAMELLDGQTLTRLLKAGPMDVGRLIELGVQIAEGLDAAHAAQIVHRDIKPANIFVSSRDHVKILDFGVAVLVPRSPSNQLRPAFPRSAAVVGTLPYMSPEQLRGEDLDSRSDLFALGVVLYEMATGRRPFNGRTSAQQILAMMTQPPIPPRDLRTDMPLELDRIISKALEQDRRLRFQSASDLRADLQRLKRDLDALRTPTSAVHPLVGVASPLAADFVMGMPERKGPGRLIGTIALGVVLGAVALGGLVARPQKSRPTGSPAASALPPLSNARSESPQSIAARAPEPIVKAPAATPAAKPAPARNSGDRELKLARSEMALKLYDQALVTLRALIAKPDVSGIATEAYFLIASIQKTQGKVEDAMATYLEISHRYRGQPQGAEALFNLGQVTLQSKRRGKETDATQAFNDVATEYPKSPWTVRALMAKAELEEQRESVAYDAVVRGAVPSALVTYRRVATEYVRYPESETALWKLGQLYEHVKRYDLAAGTFRDLAVRYPKTQHDAWFRAAELYDHRLRDSGAAGAAYKQVPPSSSHFEEARKRASEFGAE
ncbi:MAG TPA: protein kinase [Vicinamibacterales bacterium]|jgi:serine/threonine protein kinase/outer membrane protein assembly factor BamD (BamD/ComL family)|nr:protein kinase [Vicinamibacterales bacterium]